MLALMGPYIDGSIVLGLDGGAGRRGRKRDHTEKTNCGVGTMEQYL